MRCRACGEVHNVAFMQKPFSNAGKDRRTYRAPTDPNWCSTEQIAAMLSLNSATVRDKLTFNWRGTGKRGEFVRYRHNTPNDSIIVPLLGAMAMLQERIAMRDFDS